MKTEIDGIQELRDWANARVKEHRRQMMKPVKVSEPVVLGRYKSKTSKAEYVVVKHGQRLTCNCPGFTFRRRCKHTEGIE